MSVGGLSISSQAVAGVSGGNAGDIRTAESYASDQYSQVEVTSAQLSGGQWIGPAVRAQNGGQDAYVGIYYWNSGSPVLMLFKRSGGGWAELGNGYSCGPLAAGTQLELMAVGSTISFLENGVQRISVSDSSFSGGAPGIMSYGAATADNWSGGNATAASTYSVGGTVSGVSGTVVLQDNGGNDLSVSGNGPFTFSSLLAGGAAYSVTVKTNPTGQTCTVSNGSGTVAAANVTNVAVSCTGTGSTGTYSVGGTVSGVSGTVVLQDNGGNDLSVSGNGPFTFSSLLAGGAAYSVTVKTNPTGQTCTVSNGSGTVAAANVTNVAVSCTTNSASAASDDFNRADGSLGANWTDMSVGGLSISSQAVAGVSGGNAGDIRTAESYASDQYSQVEVTSAQLSGGQWIGPAVRAQNGGQDAYVGIYYWNSGSPVLMLFKRSGGGWAELGNGYSCGPLAAGTQLELMAVGSTISFLENGVQRISVSDSSFSGGAPGIMSYGAATADNWSGGNATAASTYSVGGTVSGVSGTVVLQDNGGNDLSVSGNGPFTFSSLLAGGAAYSVTVKTNPTGQTCTVSNGSGTVAAANVTNVAVSCTGTGSTGTYSVGGTVSGVSGTVVLQDNGGNDLSVSGNGPFTFSSLLAGGAAYSVTVKTNPTGQTCTVSNGSGTVAAANVTNVAVSCTTNSASAASDDFNRADGSLGANWTDMSVGGLSISSQAVAGVSGGNAGDIRTAESYASDQYSQVEVTSAQLSGGQWIGPAVRAQNGGQDAYVGIYYWNSGSPVLMLFKRSGGGWAELGNGYSCGPLAAGTQLELMAVGSTISFLENGVQRISVSDSSFSGGAPGIMSYGAATADNWSGGNATAASTYSVGGTVSGVSGTVVLQDNGGNDLSVSGNGPFTFSSLLAGGAAYSVTVKTNPTGQTCTVSNGSGTVAAANVTNVAVSCTGTGSTGTYSVGGTVSGVSGTVVLQDNGGNDLSVSGNGPFTFSSLLAGGAAYSVTVKTNPTGQTCTVSNGSGTVAAANVTNVAVSCTTNSASAASDDFNRADGSLGANWTDMSVGGLSISSQAVAGVSGGNAGDIRTAESYASDQYSQVEVTSAQLSGGQWIGPAVRAQNGGQDAYVGIYYWNSGSPVLMLFKRSGGGWAELGNGYSCGPLAAGTQLELMAVGSTISFLENGVQRISVSDSSFSGGAPGIMSYGAATADNWSGGNATAPPSFRVQYLGTDANGVKSYQVISANNGPDPQVLRVLAPTNPAPGVPHNFLYVLPVEAGLGNSFGDGLETLRALDAQDQYNLTIIEPSFEIDPWYADNPSNANVQYETFMTKELVPWVEQNLATTGNEQNWLIGFSKSGIGGQDLILKHPDLFALAASWDFPAEMSSYNQLGSDPAASYGTDANFQANYRLTTAFVDAHKAPFVSNNRIWIGGYSLYSTDMSDYDSLLTSEGIAHTTETPQYMAHRWDSGWVPIALAALRQDSINLPSAGGASSPAGGVSSGAVNSRPGGVNTHL